MLATSLNRSGLAAATGSRSSTGCSPVALGLYSLNSSTWSAPCPAKCASIAAGRGRPASSYSPASGTPVPNVRAQRCQSGDRVAIRATCTCASTSSRPSSTASALDAGAQRRDGVLAEPEPLHLAGRGQRELGQEQDMPWSLERGQPGPAPLDEAGLGRAGPGPRHHAGDGLVQPVGVGDGHHDGLLDVP